MPLEQIIQECAVCEQLDSANVKPLLRGYRCSKYGCVAAKSAGFMRLAEE